MTTKTTVILQHLLIIEATFRLSSADLVGVPVIERVPKCSNPKTTPSKLLVILRGSVDMHYATLHFRMSCNAKFRLIYYYLEFLTMLKYIHCTRQQLVYLNLVIEVDLHLLLLMTTLSNV
jgi:hypothetical protein